jgi:hypothetical protein
MISPTGKPVRLEDVHGRGCYGARRGDDRIHRGADFVCIPGQEVVFPVYEAKVARISKPYNDDLRWSGLKLRAPHLELFLWYLEPLAGIVGQWVHQGDVLGHAQDIGLKYPGITPHIHLEIESINPVLFVNYV